MARSLIKGAPELSRLFCDVLPENLLAFLSAEQFAAILGEETSSELRKSPDAERLKILIVGDDRSKDGANRIKVMEAEARRITALSEVDPDRLMRRLSEGPAYATFDGIRHQRDALARSIWAYHLAYPLFEATERAMQVIVNRDRGRIYEAWEIDASRSLSVDELDVQALETEIAEKLHHDDGCKVEVLSLPAEDDKIPDVLIAVTFFGAFASQRNVRPDKSTETIYYRPPDEMLLVYSRARRRIEICSRDPAERRIVADLFASEILGHDVSNKPLTQKTYDLAPFRRSLTLTIPEALADRVQQACIIEVQVALGDWSRRVTLTVTPEEDINRIARDVFGAVIPRTGGGYITRVRFYIRLVEESGRKSTLRFDVFGRNKSNIQTESDPAKRRIGYELLEAWDVLSHIGDLSSEAQDRNLPGLLALYDMPDEKVTSAQLEQLGLDSVELTRSGHLNRSGWSDVVLFDDDDLGVTPHHVSADRASGTATLSVADGGEGAKVPIVDLQNFEVRREYIRDMVRELIAPLGLKGRIREISPFLHQIGEARIGIADVPIYLARGLDDSKQLGNADRDLRGESRLTGGIVFTTAEVQVPFLASHVVLTLGALINEGSDTLDPVSVEVEYNAKVALARSADVIRLLKCGADAVTLFVPGQEPRVFAGHKRVRLLEKLLEAHMQRKPGVQLTDLRHHAQFSGLSQLFAPNWSDIENRYIHSPKRGYWALGAQPTSI